MKQIDPMLYLRIINDTGPDVPVKHFIGKTEVVFVRLSGEAVDRSLLNERLR